MGVFKEEPERVDVLGKQLQCHVCGNRGFYKREAQMHTAGMSFMNLEWTQPTCTCAVCSNCGFVHWFFPRSNARLEAQE